MRLTVITRRTAECDLRRMTRGKNSVPAALLAFRAAVVDGPERCRITAHASTRDAAAQLAYDTVTDANPGEEFTFARRDAGLPATED